MRILLLILMFFPFLANSQKIVWNEGFSVMEIGDKLELLEDETGTLTYEQVSSSDYQSKFQTSDKINLSLGYKESFFWLRIPIDNQSDDNVIIEMAQAGLPIVDLYYQNDNKEIVHIAAGYQIPVNDKIIKNSFQAFSLPKGNATYYIRFNSNSEPVPVRLYTQKEYEIKSLHQNFSYGIYLGLMAFVVLINLFFFVSLKKSIHLFYSFIVLLYISYSAAVIDGFIVYFIPEVDLIFLYTTIPSIGVAIQTMYCLLFLEAKKYTPKLYKIVVGIVIYFGIWTIIKFFLSFPVVQPVNTVNALISFFVMGFVGVKVGARGNKLGYYFAIAYFIYFVLVAIQAIYITTGSPEYVGGLSHVAFATLIEAFLLTYLLSKRVEWEKEEIEKDKVEAQQKVIEATRENERIVQEQNVILEQKVTSRTEQLNCVNEELRAINEKLIELDNYKESMTGMIVHDFKNSLNTIISFSEVTPTEKRLQSIHNAGRFMLNMAMNILDVQKFETTQIQLSPIKNSITPIINEVVEQLHYLLDQKSIKLKFNLDTSLICQFDEELTIRVFVNVLSNAIKYAPINGSIEIRSELKDNMGLFTIIDNGAGIPADKIHTVFDKFSQINARSSGSIRSTGIGLTFCKMAVEALGGMIWMESEEGKGSSFFFTLPIVKLMDDGKSKNINRKVPNFEMQPIVFSKEEKELLKPGVYKLKQWEVYDYSEVSAIIENINGDSDNIIRWAEQLTKALHNVNNERYNELINMNLSMEDGKSI